MEKLKPQSQDMLHLDAMRFFAASAIVFLHWKTYCKPIPGHNILPNPESFLSLAVDLFFLISGVVMFQVYSRRLYSWRDFGSFMQRRVARLYPLHLLTLSVSMMYGLGAYILHLHANHPGLYKLDGVIPNILLIQAFPVIHHGSFNGVAWSISAEMGCYVSLPAALVLYRRRWWAPALLGLATAAAFTLFWTHGWEWTNATYSYGFFRAIPTFFFGVALGGSGRVLRRIPYPNILFGIFACGVFALGFMGAPHGILYLLVYLIGITGFACDVQGTAGRFISAVAPLGQLTYSIYLIHGILEPSLFNFVYARLQVSAWLRNSIIAATFVPMVMLAYLSFVYFETPARRWVSGLGSKRTVRAEPLVAGHADANGGEIASSANTLAATGQGSALPVRRSACE